MKTSETKKVLIALDYNPTAQKVAEEGYKLASAMDAEVVLLHIVAEPVYYSSTAYSPIMGFGGYTDIDFLKPDIITELKDKSLHFLDRSKQHLADESIETIVKDGDLSDTILATAKELHAEFIVMGSHSRRWLEAVLIGSVTEKVLHHTTIPLFIIPTKKRN